MSFSVHKRSTFLGLIALAIILYSLATAVMLWPLPLSLGVGVQDLGDPYLQMWEMRWVQHQLITDPLRLFDANIFHPFPLSLAYSDAGIPAAVFGWPIYLLSGNIVLTYNLVLISTFILAGIGAALLVWYLSGNYTAGLIAGFIYAFVPYRFGHLSHLNLLGYGWIPLAILALVLIWQRRSAWAAVAFGILIAVQALTAFHYFLVLAVGIALYLLLSPLLHWKEWNWQPLALSLGGLALGIAIMAPFLMPYMEVQQGMGFVRTIADAEKLSARPETFISVSIQNHFWEGRLPTAYPSPLFPGAVALILALPGIALVRRRPHALFFLLAALVAGVLALGPTLNPGAADAIPLPFRWLFENIPGFSGMRDPSRFGALALLGVTVLAGLGLAGILDWLRNKIHLQENRQMLWLVPLAAVLTGATLLEFQATPVGTEMVKLRAKFTDVYKWIAAQPDDGAVMEFPADELMVDPVRSTTWYVFASTYHWRPLVQGYSGFVPQAHYEILDKFRGPELPLSVENIGLVQDLGVRYLIIHRERYEDWPSQETKLIELENKGYIKQRGDFGESRVAQVLPQMRQPIGLSFGIPDTAVISSTVHLNVNLNNENPNLGLVHAGWPPAIKVQWLEQNGRVVLDSKLEPAVPAVIGKGVVNLPIEIAAPREAGNYRLRVESRNLPEVSMEREIEVRASAIEQTSGPPVSVSVEWEKRAYKPGETLTLNLEWSALASMKQDYTAFAQIVGPDNRIIGQKDAQPLEGARPTSTWAKGEKIDDRWEIQIAPDAPAGTYRVLIGMYAPERPLERLPMLGPDGTVLAQGYEAGILEIK